jgi:predicted  nucleic acid-binding Zn-ribbon protein
MLNQDLIEKQEEIEKLCAENQELNKQLVNSNGIIEKKDKKISELISESEQDKEKAKDLLSKKDEMEKELKEKVKSIEGKINQLTKGNVALFQKNEE